MKLQSQFHDSDRKKEINGYAKRDTVLHLIIIGSVVLFLAIYAVVVNAPAIDSYCEQLLK